MLSESQRGLVEDNVEVVKSIAYRMWVTLTGYSRDEFEAWGYLGLVTAALRWPQYCAERNFEAWGDLSPSWFRTYASRRIRGQIIDAMRADDPATRRERALVKQIRAGGVDLSLFWDRVSAETIAAKAGMCPDDVRRAVGALMRSPLPLSEVSELAVPRTLSAEDAAMCSAACAVMVQVINSFHSGWKRQVVAMSIFANMPIQRIVDELPDLRADPVMGPNAGLWVEHWVSCARDQIRRKVREVVG